jgi:hypothetical protein
LRFEGGLSAISGRDLCEAGCLWPKREKIALGRERYYERVQGQMQN